MAELTADLAQLRDGLVAEWLRGNRRRLSAWLVTIADRAQVSARAGSEVQRLATYHAVLAAVAATSRRPALARTLSPALWATCSPESPLAAFCEPDAAQTYAELALYRPELVLPAALGRADLAPVRTVHQALLAALGGLPTELWRAVALAAAQPPPAASELAVVVPPGESEWSFPAELAAATPADALVVDARAERLSLAETVEEVVAGTPNRVVVWCDEPPVAAELVAALRAQRPDTWYAAWGGPERDPDRPDVPFDAVLRPPFDLGAGPDFPPPTAWPLACYARVATDADVVIPVAGRAGGQLATDLTRTLAACPAAEARLGPGLSAAQADELLAALALPVARGWSLAIAQPDLPPALAGLRAAQLRQVVLTVGPAAVPASHLATIGAALADLGLSCALRVDVTGCDLPALSALVTAATGASAQAVTWHGTPAPDAAAVWAEMVG